MTKEEFTAILDSLDEGMLEVVYRLMQFLLDVEEGQVPPPTSGRTS